MTLCVSVVTQEGIVVAGDSRQTQVIGGINRIGSDNGVKVFALTDAVLAATSGWAYLKPQNAPLMRNVASLVEDFRITLAPGASVLDVATAMWTHFNALYQQHVMALPLQAVAAGQVALSFAVSGYDTGDRIGKLYQFDVPSATAPTIPSRTSENPGAWYLGQMDVALRIIAGFDGRLLELPFVQAANQNNAVMPDLGGLGYMVGFMSMTLQDAIDFAVGMIQITATVQRFTAGTVAHPGGTVNVGGPIDVAVIQPGATVKWVHRKELHV